MKKVELIISCCLSSDRTFWASEPWQRLVVLNNALRTGYQQFLDVAWCIPDIHHVHFI